MGQEQARPRGADVPQRKRDAVLRLLRGERLETGSRSLGVTAATLSGWRDAFLAAGAASLSTRARIVLLEARPGPWARRTHK